MFGSFAFGVSTSGLFALFLAIPADFGVKFKPKQVSTMMAASVLASGLVTSITGELMSYKTEFLFYWLAIMSGWLVF